MGMMGFGATISLAAAPLVLKNRVIARRYSGYFYDNVTYQNGRTPTATYVVLPSSGTPSIGLANAGGGGDNFTVIWEGYFIPLVSGTHTFSTTSDDGSFLWIGDVANAPTTSNATVKNGGTHSASKATGTATLTAGVVYPFRAIMGEEGGGEYMEVTVTPPGGSETNDLWPYLWATAASVMPKIISRSTTTQSVTIGQCVSTAIVDMWGAGGGRARYGYGNRAGGSGGYQYLEIPVAAGDVLTYAVGGKGEDANTAYQTAGGMSGSGQGNGGPGGAPRITNLLSGKTDMLDTSVWTEPLSGNGGIVRSRVVGPANIMNATRLDYAQNNRGAPRLIRAPLSLAAGTYTFAFDAKLISGTGNLTFDINDISSSWIDLFSQLKLGSWTRVKHTFTISSSGGWLDFPGDTIASMVLDVANLTLESGSTAGGIGGGNGGGGGGRTEIYKNGVLVGVAPGGGGGGVTDGYGNGGGPGGGLQGGDVGETNGVAGARGGTQSGPGAGGYSINNSGNVGGAGSGGNGGAAQTPGNTGGGGGGYYGGGGGAQDPQGQAGAGAGGSAYSHPTLTRNASTLSGSGTTPPKTNHPDYTGNAGRGGYSSAFDSTVYGSEDGLIVIDFV
ncbi:PA14 domain-containing protein [Azospirillum sp. Sh1]|uniref:GLEYA domain-containing protein n=1 Tax=Azospirillum sp. Sh1 TaxID=2607285 RepID=UPI00165E1C6E|nr:PA14 domain-containing protein [Azospirillum sp. Sh1]